MDLATRQRQFAAHLRDPEHVAPPADVEPRRMQVYRELFIANVTGLLAATFPVTLRLIGEEAWQALVRRFYAGHKAHTPYFHELPREFVEWLAAREARPAGEPPFLDELAHYEWVELALALSEDEPSMDGVDPGADLLANCPVLSPNAWPLAYRWPVHRLSQDYQPAEPPAQPSFLLVYRDDADSVRFMEISPLTAGLLELAGGQPDATGESLLATVTGGEPAPEVRAAAAAVLEDLRRQGVILGARSPGWSKE